MVKYDGTTFKSKENFVNVPERLLEIAGSRCLSTLLLSKNLSHRSYNDDTNPQVEVLGSHCGIYVKLHDTLQLNYKVKSKKQNATQNRMIIYRGKEVYYCILSVDGRAIAKLWQCYVQFTSSSVWINRSQGKPVHGGQSNSSADVQARHTPFKFPDFKCR